MNGQIKQKRPSLTDAELAELFASPAQPPQERAPVAAKSVAAGRPSRRKSLSDSELEALFSSPTRPTSPSLAGYSAGRAAAPVRVSTTNEIKQYETDKYGAITMRTPQGEDTKVNPDRIDEFRSKGWVAKKSSGEYEKPQYKPEYLNAIKKSILQGLTAGFGDESIALGTAWGKHTPYKEEYLAEKENMRRLEQEYPKTMFAGDILGGLALGGAGLARQGVRAVGRAAVGEGGKLLSNAGIKAMAPVLGRRMAENAAIGSASSFAYSPEETFSGKLKDAVIGAPVGAVLGEAAPKVISAAAKIPAKATKYAMSLQSGLSPSILSEYFSRNKAIRKARPVEAVTDELNEKIGGLVQDIYGGSKAASDYLEKTGKVINGRQYEDIFADTVKEKMRRGIPSDDKTKKQLSGIKKNFIDYAINNFSSRDDTGKIIPGTARIPLDFVKEQIKTLDKMVEWDNVPFTSAINNFRAGLRHNVDTLLKKDKEYAKIMDKVSADSRLFSPVKQAYENPEAMDRLLMRVAKGKSPRKDKMIAELSARIGAEPTQEVRDAVIKDLFSKDFIRGSRNVNMFKAAGGAIGKNLGPIGETAGKALGALYGYGVDKFGRPVTKAAIDTAATLRDLPGDIYSRFSSKLSPEQPKNIPPIEPPPSGAIAKSPTPPPPQPTPQTIPPAPAPEILAPELLDIYTPQKNEQIKQAEKKALDELIGKKKNVEPVKQPKNNIIDEGYQQYLKQKNTPSQQKILIDKINEIDVTAEHLSPDLPKNKIQSLTPQQQEERLKFLVEDLQNLESEQYKALQQKEYLREYNRAIREEAQQKGGADLRQLDKYVQKSTGRLPEISIAFRRDKRPLSTLHKSGDVIASGDYGFSSGDEMTQAYEKIQKMRQDKKKIRSELGDYNSKITELQADIEKAKNRIDELLKNSGVDFDPSKFIIPAAISGAGTAYTLSGNNESEREDRAKQALFLGAIGIGAKGRRFPKGSFSGLWDKKIRKEISDRAAKVLKQESGNLGDVFYHPKLYKAYPDLKKLPVKFSDNIGNISGSYSKEGLNIVKRNNPEDAKYTLLHEIQHAIQQREGWARGGSPEQFKGDIQALNELNKLPFADMDMFQQEMYKQLNSKYKGIKDPQEVYRRLTGEIEARDAASRMNMTPAERAASQPMESQGIPLNKMITRMEGGTAAEIPAYHGSPHMFDKFQAGDKIGTGEGAQAFGYGLYFTDKKDIAKNYADKLSKLQDVKLINKHTGKEISQSRKREKLKELIVKEYENIMSDGEALKNIDNDEIRKIIKDNLFYNIDEDDFTKKQIKDAYDFLDNLEIKEIKNDYLYNVILHKGKTPDQYDYLKWDEKGIKNTQRNKILQQAKKNGLNDLFYEENGKLYSRGWGGDNVDGGYTYKKISKIIGSDKAASEFLLRAGIDGIDYPAGSLSGAKGNARNYVVFDPEAVTIESVE